LGLNTLERKFAHPQERRGSALISKRNYSIVDNFVYHMRNYYKMVACKFFIIKGLKHINSGCVLRKWKKAREPRVMIRRLKARIPEMVMQRQSPMDAREKESKKC
jgi:hypothetical protein